ncbi:hypothetical protein EON65_40665 [archaeon]|nr:MAG: hypothetical protein EON65_40665 [archaeon]
MLYGCMVCGYTHSHAHTHPHNYHPHPYTAKSGTLEDVVELLELVVGVCVLCEDKGQFIGAIFQLNSTSQV